MSPSPTTAPGELERALTRLILEESQKIDDIDPACVRDDEMLFGEQSRIGLDSLDALQISVALRKHYGVRLQGDRAVRQHMMNVRDLAAFVRRERGA